MPGQFESILDKLQRKLGKQTIRKASSIARPKPRPDVIQMQAINDFVRRNPKAGGGLLNGSSEEAAAAAFRKKVDELMDDGYDFGEAVREAMRQGYENGGLSTRGAKQVFSKIGKKVSEALKEKRVLSKEMKKYLKERFPKVKNYKKFYRNASKDDIANWKKALPTYLEIKKIPNIEKAGKFPFGTQAVGGYVEKVKLIKQFNELKPTLKTMGKGTGEIKYTEKPFTLDEWLNAGPERRKIGRMTKEEYLEYRGKTAKISKAYKKKEKGRLSPSEYDEKYNLPKREKELSEARKKRGKIKAGRGVLLEQNNLLLGYMSNAARKQAKIVDGVKDFIDINEDGKFVGVRDVKNNVNYYYAKYNGDTKIDGKKNKYITDHPDFENAKELKKAANKFKYDLPNETISGYFTEYKRVPRMGELANFLIRANIKLGDSKELVERKLNLLSKYNAGAISANPLHLHHMLGVEANPTKKLQLRLADQNDLAGKVVERYKNKSIDKPTAIKELKNLNVTAALDGKLEGAKENITPKAQVAVAKRRVNQMFNEALRTRPQLINDIAKRIDLDKDIKVIRKAARKVGVTLNSFAGVVDFSQAGVELPPQVQKSLDKVLKYGAKTLRGIGKGAIVLDPMFAAYDFSEAIDRGVGGKEAAKYTGKRFVEGVLNLPDLVASGAKFAKDKAQGKDTEFKTGTLYEPFTFAQESLDKAEAATPKATRLRNIAQRDFDTQVRPGMTMVDDMEIPASREQIKAAEQDFIKNQMGPYYKYGLENLVEEEEEKPLQGEGILDILTDPIYKGGVIKT